MNTTVNRTSLRAACPHCAAVFRLTDAQMGAREGLVRCGACRQIFNAKWHLASHGERRIDGDGERRIDGDGERRIAGDGIAKRIDGDGVANRIADDGVAKRADRLAPKLEASPAVDARSPGRPARSVEHYLKPRAHPLARIMWGAAALALVVLLAAQVKYLLVERYAGHAVLRPYLAAFCELAACRLPPRHDPRRFAITRTNIDLHPRQPGALRVTVKLLNEATYPQPYPRLRLTLTDRDGWVVGRRAYAPADYLIGRPNKLQSGELGAIHLDLARPHEKAVGFEVDVF